MSTAALNLAVDQFVTKIKQRQIVGSHATAVQTVLLLRMAISQSRWNSVETLLDILRSIGRTIISSAPLELSIGNTVRRVMRTIRDEASGESDAIGLDDSKLQGSFKSQSSMYNLLAEAVPAQTTSSGKAHFDLKATVIEAVNDILDELEQVHRTVSAQALEHIHTNEIIMTIGISKTVSEFFKAAARKRKFQVIVAETAPWYDGHHLALDLAQAGIDTTIITDSAIFAIMARVNKVIIGTHAVLANGGLIARSGCHLVASAAKHHSTPVVVVTGLFKLSPLYAFDQDTFNSLASPAHVLEFEDASSIDKVDVCTPFFDYVPPDLVNLFVTNSAGHPPSYIYRLLSEYYHTEDDVI